MNLEGDGVADGLLYQDYRHESSSLNYCLCKLLADISCSNVIALQGSSLRCLINRGYLDSLCVCQFHAESIAAYNIAKNFTLLMLVNTTGFAVMLQKDVYKLLEHNHMHTYVQVHIAQSIPYWGVLL